MREAIGRLLVVRLGSLGDLVHALPAVAALRRAHPYAQIDWLVDAVHRELLELVPVISTVVPLGRPTLEGWRQVRRELKARQYEVVVDLQGLIKSAALARLSGASRIVGFDRRAARESWAAMFYTEAIAVGDQGHVIDKNLRLVAALGAPTDERVFPLTVPSSSVLDLVQRTVAGPFAVVNCGAAWPNKRWPPERFGRVAAWLDREHGLRSVVLWGPGEESLAREVAVASARAAIVAPRSGLGDLVALLSAARIMVSGDTGPTHVAAALGTPVVALFGPTTPQRNGPWAEADISLARYDQCECHYQRQCRHGHGPAWCLGTIDEDEVQGAIAMRLGGGPS